MANRAKKSTRRPGKAKKTSASLVVVSRAGENAPPLYLYGITSQPRPGQLPTMLGVDGCGHVEAVDCPGFTCWVSRVTNTFAESLPSNMENLDWLAGAGVRHQKVVAALAQHATILPARFGTIFIGRESLAKDVSRRSVALRRAFTKVKGADEWGIKVFRIAPRAVTAIEAATGADYLRQKAKVFENDMRQRGQVKTLSPEVQKLTAQLKKLASSVVPGGSVSQSQPGLEWHASILLSRPMQKKFLSTIESFSGLWQGTRRIEVTGPWPPYSFVKDAT